MIKKHKTFGPNGYRKNLEDMKAEGYRPATIQESISIASDGFGLEGEFDAKRDIFDPKWLQLGYLVKTSEGVFTNTALTDENFLKGLLNATKKVNGIYLIDSKTAFAPYETFKSGEQDSETFCEGGLARALEHTEEEVAENFKEISSLKHYRRGVNVLGFDGVKEPVSRVAGLDSNRRDLVGVGIDIVSYVWDGGGGCAFGLL
ncbi:MAG: hypothetical protein KJ879_02070 [Nanoarchaeota archaeon]|nr:hypothetical protein [Nanoarchaeota archaeon]